MSKSITFEETTTKPWLPVTALQAAEFRPHSSSCSARIGGAERPRGRLRVERSTSFSSVSKSKTDCDSGAITPLDASTNAEPGASSPEGKCNVYTISSGRDSPVDFAFQSRRDKAEPDSVSRNYVCSPSTEESFKVDSSSSSLNLATLLSLIYAIFIVCVGGVLSATYHGHTFVDKSTNQIFSCAVAIIGMAWLMFLHIDLTRYKKLILARIKSNIKDFENMADRISFVTEYVINGQYCWRKSSGEGEEEFEPHYRFLKGRHSGSFFLKAGMAAFCSGHIIHEGLMLSKEVIDWKRGEALRYGQVISVALHCLRPLYSFYQLFIAFKYSNIVINRHKNLAQFGVMHLIATSLHMWFTTIVDDAVATHSQYLNNTGVARPDDANHSGAELPDGDRILHSSFSSAAYLYPCTIEYSIILAGVWFIVWQNIGKVHHRAKSQHLEQKVNGADGSVEIHYESNLVISADCHSANKGLFAGILVLLASVISVVIFFVLVHSHSFIYNLQEGILTALGLIAGVLAYFRVVRLDRNAHPVMFLDNFLLFIPLPFYMIHAVLCIMADMHVNETTRIVIRVFSVVQIVVQTPLLIDGLRRCSNSHVLRYQKPGREIITFLLVLNVTHWIVFTVEQRHTDDLLAAKAVYGCLWLFIGHATIPLMLFYRFHSAVCLADIWQSAYHKGE